eukprot:1049056_1
MAKQIQSFVPPSKAIIEVVNVGTTDQNNEVDISLSVQWYSNTSKVEIQNNLEETLTDFKYSTDLKNYLNTHRYTRPTRPKQNLKMLKIIIKGDSSADEMRIYMINKLYEPALKRCQYTIEKPIALKNMNHQHIIDLVSYHILNDDKY